MGSQIFGFFGVRLFFIFTVSKRTRMFVNQKNGCVHICPKVTKMGSIIGHRVDYNGVRALRGQGHIPNKT